MLLRIRWVFRMRVSILRRIIELLFIILNGWFSYYNIQCDSDHYVAKEERRRSGCKRAPYNHLVYVCPIYVDQE